MRKADINLTVTLTYEDGERDEFDYCLEDVVQDKAESIFTYSRSRLMNLGGQLARKHYLKSSYFVKEN